MHRKNGIWEPRRATWRVPYHRMMGVLNLDHPRFFYFFLFFADVLRSDGFYVLFLFAGNGVVLVGAVLSGLVHDIDRYSTPGL